MTRALPVSYKRLTRSAAAPVILIILLVTLVLCLSNFSLIKYAVIGILAGLIFWKWPPWMRYVLGVAIVIIFLTSCGANEASPAPHYYWSAKYDTTITLNSSGQIWTVNETVTIPGDALRQITEGNGKSAVTLSAPGPNQYALDAKKFTQMIQPYRPTYLGLEDGTAAIYSFRASTLTHRIPVVPLVTTQTVNIRYLTLPSSVNVIPGDDSKVRIDAPSGIVEATTPTSQAGPTTTGEERVINADSFSDFNAGSENVRISVLSVMVRDKPLRSIAGLSLAGGISWAIAAIWALLVALAKTGAKGAATSGWKRIRRTKAQPDADKADQKDEGDKPAEPQKPTAPAGE